MVGLCICPPPAPPPGLLLQEKWVRKALCPHVGLPSGGDSRPSAPAASAPFPSPFLRPHRWVSSWDSVLPGAGAGQLQPSPWGCRGKGVGRDHAESHRNTESENNVALRGMAAPGSWLLCLLLVLNSCLPQPFLYTGPT